MTVYTEFSIDADQFPFGQSLETEEQRTVIELERVIPTDEELLSYIWVHDCTPDTFLRRVKRDPSVNEIALLDDVDDRSLFRLAWDTTVVGLLDAIMQADAVILEGTGNHEWVFRLRFPDHARITDFYNACQQNSTTVHLNYIYTMVDTQRGGYLFDLTAEQCTALTRAVEEGYYDVPRGMTLEDLAGELEITRQAASERVRRGAGKVLSAVLLGSTAIDTGR